MSATLSTFEWLPWRYSRKSALIVVAPVTTNGHTRNYSIKQDLMADVLAGLVVGIMVVPQGLAYAQVAGLPLQTGLYSSIVGVGLYWLMGSCREASLGPTAILSLLTGQALMSIVPPDQGVDRLVATAFSLTLISGILMLALGLLPYIGKALLAFVSQPVISGFTTGSALSIIVSQTPKILGIPGKLSSVTYLLIWDIAVNLPSIKVPDLLIGSGTLTFLIALDLVIKSKFMKRHSRWLLFLTSCKYGLVLIVSTLITFLLTNLNIQITRIINVPNGLPVFTAPALDFSKIWSNFGAYVTIALVALLEHIAIATSMSQLNHYDIHIQREIVTVGVLNILSCFVGSYPITNSFSRSALNSRSGVRSPLSGIATMIVVLLALASLTSVFKFFSIASLAAVIADAVKNLIIKPQALRTMCQTSIVELCVFIITTVGTFLFSAEIGILCGTLTLLASYLYRISRPSMSYKRVDKTGTTETKVVLVAYLPAEFSYICADYVMSSVRTEFNRTDTKNAITDWAWLRSWNAFGKKNVSLNQDHSAELIQQATFLVIDLSRVRSLDSSSCRCMSSLICLTCPNIAIVHLDSKVLCKWRPSIIANAQVFDDNTKLFHDSLDSALQQFGQTYEKNCAVVTFEN